MLAGLVGLDKSTIEAFERGERELRRSDFAKLREIFQLAGLDFRPKNHGDVDSKATEP